MNSSLLIVAHGSRRAESNREVETLAARIGELAGGRFVSVRPAFLELAAPSIPDGIQQCLDDGAAEVLVLPYFLSRGRHVVEDIPAEIAAKQAERPAARITLLPYLGAAEGVAELMLALGEAGA